MKNVILILIFSFFISCENDCFKEVEELQNNSGRKVEIVVYKNHAPNIAFGTYSTTHIIENNQKISQNEKVCAPYNSRLDFIELIQGDSIIIDFGDRKLRFGIINKTSPRNPFYLANIDIAKPNFAYTLTPEDYANALP